MKRCSDAIAFLHGSDDTPGFVTRPHIPQEAFTRLRTPLALTKGGMVLERLWQAGWPLVTVLLLSVCLVGFDVAGLSGTRAIVTGFLAAAGLISLVFAARQLRWPTHEQALARLDETLPGQPIAALLDQQANGLEDAASIALWQAYQTRMAARLSDAKAVAPDLVVAHKDPFALRLIALVGATLAIGFAPFGPLEQSATTTGNEGTALAPASWEGWIEPPGYTGHPSLYLADQASGPLSVPKGSRLTLRAYGDLEAISIGGSLLDRKPNQPTTHNFAQEITKSGTLSIEAADSARWTVSAIGDTPPAIRPNGPLTRQLNGDFAIGFVAADDYGVSHGRVELQLAPDRADRRHGLSVEPEPRAPLVVDLPLPYRGSRKLVESVLEENVAEHAFAGLPVDLYLWVEDGAGQIGESQPLPIILPGRRFLHPVARAIIEQRRDLLWNRANARRVTQILRATLNRPEELALPDGVYLQLRSAISRLEAGLAFADVADGLPSHLRDEVAQALWQAAVELEDGQLEDARARMENAQKRLEQAMRDGASPEELAELMDEFRQAMKDFMEQLAQRQQTDPGENRQLSENAIELNQSDLDEMMKRIEELMREGRQDEAMQLLDQLRQMMDNMQMAQNGEGQQPGDSAREGLQDTLRQQQGLSDRAFRDLQEQGQGAQAGESQGNEGRDGGQGRGQSHDGSGGQQGQAGEGAGQEQEGGQGQGGGLSEQQRALRDQLDEQRRNLPGAGDEAGQAARDALDDAGRAMGGAADALEQGDLPGALDRQAEAMQALREGMRRFDEAMANEQARRQGEQGGNPGESQNAGTQDPLGRGPTGRSGATSTDSPLGDTEDVYRRAQELMQELRRRSGESERPELERDYLKRLLDQF